MHGSVSSAVIDRNGGFYVAGGFTLTGNFDPTGGVDIHEITPPTFYQWGDIFISRFGLNGSYQWTRTIGGVGVKWASAISLDQEGNIVVTGGFTDTVDFDPGDGVDERSTDGYLVGRWFIWKLDPDGNHLGVITPGIATITSSASSHALDEAENIFIAGTFAGSLDFDPGPGEDVRASVGNSYDIFITRLNADGSYGWTRTIGNGNNESFGGMVLDPFGDLVLVGNFRGTVDFDPGPGVDPRTAQHTYGDIFLTKFGGDGAYRWTHVFPAYNNPGNYSRKVAVDAEGNIYLAGAFNVPTDFDPGPGVDLRVPWSDPPGSADIFVSKFRPDGGYVWTFTAGGPGDDVVSKVLVTEQGEILIGGEFKEWIDLSPGHPDHVHVSRGRDDVLVFGLDAEDGNVRWSRSFGGVGSEFLSSFVSGPNGELLLFGKFGVGVGATLEVDLNPGCVEDRLSIGDTQSNSYLLRLACVAPTADANGDGIIDLRDLAAFQACFTGPAPTVCQKGCEIFDFDQDDDIDLDDFAAFSAFLQP